MNDKTILAMATDTLEVHADIQPMELVLQDACHRAAIRLASLPATHPLHKPVRSCASRAVKHHISPLHTLMHTFDIKPDALETVSLATPSQ